jgi:hypothetical protein
MAFGCKDPSITFLNQYGYNVVKLPRAGIDPLLVLGRDRSLEPLGALDTVWKAPASAPSPGKPTRAVNIDGQKTEKLDLSIGLKMLSNALAAFGATTPSLDVSYKNVRKVQFTLTNVWSVSVAPFVVGEYLASGDLNLSNPVVERFFGNDSSTAYIITEVLKSDTISVTASGSQSTAVDVDIPAISGIAGVTPKVEVHSDKAGTLTFKGKEMLTFGFKAMEILYADGRWAVMGTKPSGKMAFAHEDEKVGGVLFNRGGLVSLVPLGGA